MNVGNYRLGLCCKYIQCNSKIGAKLYIVFQGAVSAIFAAVQSGALPAAGQEVRSDRKGGAGAPGPGTFLPGSHSTKEPFSQVSTAQRNLSTR